MAYFVSLCQGFCAMLLDVIFSKFVMTKITNSQ